MSRGSTAMHVLVAANSFKGTLSSTQACAAIAEGVRAAGPSWTTEELPLADGGEGTLDVLLRARSGRRLRAGVHGPLGAQVHAHYGMLDGEATALVEMAEASGLLLAEAGARDVLKASSFGTGELICAAVEGGARQVLLAVGGSATCDGGAGCLQALGVRLLDSHGEELRAGIGGGELERIAGIDAAQARIALQQVQLEVLCDVRNPMVGPHGSARVYAPQKGATPAQVEVLERGLVHFARIIANHLGVQIANMPHAGAAGGLAGGLCGMLGARLRPGAEFVLDWIGFDAKVRAADAVITGEGRLDDQSLSGKMVQAVARQARLLGIPTYVLAGSVALSRAAVKEHFVDAAGIENTSSATPFEALRALARQQAPMWFSAAQS